LHIRLMERRQLFNKVWREPGRRIAALLEEGKAAGEFDPDIPTPVMLSLFWGMISAHTHRLLVVEERMPSGIVVAHLSRFFFKGLAPGGDCSTIPPQTPHQME